MQFDKALDNRAIDPGAGIAVVPISLGARADDGIERAVHLDLKGARANHAGEARRDVKALERENPTRIG